jgi:hypothetical protein
MIVSGSVVQNKLCNVPRHELLLPCLYKHVGGHVDVLCFNQFYMVLDPFHRNSMVFEGSSSTISTMAPVQLISKKLTRADFLVWQALILSAL